MYSIGIGIIWYSIARHHDSIPSSMFPVSIKSFLMDLGFGFHIFYIKKWKEALFQIFSFLFWIWDLCFISFTLKSGRSHFAKYSKKEDLCRKNSVRLQSETTQVQSFLNLRLSALNWQIITSYIELVSNICLPRTYILANVWKKYIRQSRISPAS